MIIISEVWDFWGFVFPSLNISVCFGFIEIKKKTLLSLEKEGYSHLNKLKHETIKNILRSQLYSVYIYCEDLQTLKLKKQLFVALTALFCWFLAVILVNVSLGPDMESPNDDQFVMPYPKEHDVL